MASQQRVSLHGWKMHSSAILHVADHEKMYDCQALSGLGLEINQVINMFPCRSNIPMSREGKILRVLSLWYKSRGPQLTRNLHTVWFIRNTVKLRLDSILVCISYSKIPRE